MKCSVCGLGLQFLAASNSSTTPLRLSFCEISGTNPLHLSQIQPQPPPPPPPLPSPQPHG